MLDVSLYVSSRCSMAEIPILKLGVNSLAEWFSARAQPAYRAQQVRRWIFQRRASQFEGMTDLSQDLRSALAEEFAVFASRLESTQVTADDTRKLLVRLADGQ